MNRIGDLGLLVGIFILGNLFSTLDYATLKRLLPVQQILICIGFLLLLLYSLACGKSAQIPLYTWLPDDGWSNTSFSIDSRGYDG
jgi:NADH-quinone oxidoreductase subunit L